MAEGKGSYILSDAKEPSELDRLNLQHNLIKAFWPVSIHDAIPKYALFRIADVGTGTGIWLEELAVALDEVPLQNGAVRQYDGFDISDAFLPKDSGTEFHYIKHDVLKPFPQEYHGRYNLVHLRFLLAALKKEEIPVAVQNVAQLLAPDGFIQWDEWDSTSNKFVPENKDMQKTWDDLMAFLSRSGFATDIGRLLIPAFQNQGLDQVKQSKHWNFCDAETTARSVPLIKTWQFALWKTLMPLKYKRKDDGEERSVEEVDRIVVEKMDLLEDFVGGGGSQSFSLVSTVGQK